MTPPNTGFVGGLFAAGDSVPRQILRLIATGDATNKAEIVRRTGLARSTVTDHLSRLESAGLVVEAGSAMAVGRGRPPRVLALSDAAGVVLAADVGTTKTTVAVADINRRILDQRTIACPLADGPNAALHIIATAFEDMLGDTVSAGTRIQAMAMGLPSPVDTAGGRPIHPPLMPGWDRYPVAETLAERFATHVILDNDVNLMAIGETSATSSAPIPLLLLHISDGIGCGIITSNGELLRGADGAAGDVGHLRSHGHDDTVCRCGNVGCIESVASVTAIEHKLRERLSDQEFPPDATLVALVKEGNPLALNEVRRAAMEIGEIAVTLVHTFNPASLILSGPLAEVSDDLLSGVRAMVYRRALPLATRALHIGTSALGEQAGIRGAIRLATEHVFTAPLP